MGVAHVNSPGIESLTIQFPPLSISRHEIHEDFPINVELVGVATFLASGCENGMIRQMFSKE